MLSHNNFYISFNSISSVIDVSIRYTELIDVNKSLTTLSGLISNHV